MNIGQKGLDLIRSFEGLRLHAYKAVPTEEYYTIGYGHYGPDVKSNESITEAQAEELLKRDLQRFVTAVTGMLKTTVNQNQFDALVSFAYNCGPGNLKTSTLLAYVNQRNFKAAAAEFGKWTHAGGKVLQGLVRRRAAEAKLFATPVPVTTPAKPATPPKEEKAMPKDKFFTDMEGHWTQSEVDFWAERKIIHGHDDGSYKPDEPVTRGEFAVLLKRLLEQGYLIDPLKK